MTSRAPATASLERRGGDAVGGGARGARRAVAQPDHDVDPAVGEVERLRAALVAIAEDRDALARRAGRGRCRRRGSASIADWASPPRRAAPAPRRRIVERLGPARPVAAAAGGRTRYIGAWHSAASRLAGGDRLLASRSRRAASAPSSRTPIARITGKSGSRLARQQRLDFVERAVARPSPRSAGRSARSASRAAAAGSAGVSAISSADPAAAFAPATRPASGPSSAPLRARARCGSCRRG